MSKPNKLRVDQRREFDNKLMQKWLDNSDILMYLTYNEGKSWFQRGLIKTLKARSNKKRQLIIVNLILVI